MSLVGAAAVLLLLDSGCGKVYQPEEMVRAIELPAGTELMVTPAEPIDLEEMETGAQFAGTLELPLIRDNVVIAPKGAPVGGEFVVDAQAEDEGVLPLGIRLTSLMIHGGQEASLTTAPVFPEARAEAVSKPEVREDAVLMFVLTEPTQVSWSMDAAPGVHPS
ncbi:MAG: hypothetical protein GC160_08280 [Acidobacteria bacterium]|nr:hypothetical protein [Acidobacteriota bacterium]